ncbi:MAG: succinate dehydrogenase, cytochrome b556 subunit [Pelagibacterales bacterium]|nr:succinate dehydrogenase, cytochrome b556 subunit [Pelagibacterales bacterium]
MSKQNLQNKKLPTSPHLQIYRWNVSSITSIFHRLTGVILYFSIVTICWYLVFYTYQMNVTEQNEESCDCLIKGLMGYILWIAGCGITFALYYHFCNGIRHLFWDLGKGFDKETARTNGFLVIISAIVLTTLTVGSVIYFKLF